jgi:hypothetical protein
MSGQEGDHCTIAVYYNNKKQVQTRKAMGAVLDFQIFQTAE